MKEIFRHSKLHRVTRYQDVLEGAGIDTLLCNETLSVTEAPIPEFYPKAVQLLEEHEKRTAEGVETAVVCSSYRAENPGNFDFYYPCEKPISPSETC